jgi:hypothetical protein
MWPKTVRAISSKVADNNADRSARRSVDNPASRSVPNIPHRNRAHRKVAGLSTAVVVARNRAAAIVPSSRSVGIAKAATNGISPAAPPATSGVSARDRRLRSHSIAN